MPSSLTIHEVDFTIKKTKLGLGKVVDYNHHYDLMEHMTYVFINVVRAHGLVVKDANGIDESCKSFFCHHAFVHHFFWVH